jgi:hypothetical protein
VRGGVAHVSRGTAVQVDPIKPKLKPPGTKLLKLKCDILLSTSAFKSNLRRYIVVGAVLQRTDGEGVDGRQAGAYTRPLLSSA